MLQLGSIIPYCKDGTQFYYIPRVQIPLAQQSLQPRVQMPLAQQPLQPRVQMSLGNKQNINPIIKNGINKNSINKSISHKIITIDMVKKSCAYGCPWP